MDQPIKKRKQPRYALTKNKYLFNEEFEHLMQIVRKFEQFDLRNCLIIQLALKTGARAQELLNLKKEDLTPSQCSVFIRGLKDSDDRDIPIPPDLFNKIYKYSKSLEGELLFPISYQRLYQIWNIYRPVKKKFHSLRHTFAFRIYQKTKDIRLVQRALGHRGLRNTMIYLDYHYSTEEMKKLLIGEN